MNKAQLKWLAKERTSAQLKWDKAVITEDLKAIPVIYGPSYIRVLKKYGKKELHNILNKEFNGMNFKTKELVVFIDNIIWFKLKDKFIVYGLSASPELRLKVAEFIISLDDSK